MTQGWYFQGASCFNFTLSEPIMSPPTSPSPDAALAKIISLGNFAGSRRLTFHRGNVFNRVEGDKYILEDDTCTCCANRNPEHDIQGSSCIHPKFADEDDDSEPAPDLVEGDYFPDCKDVKFCQDNVFNIVKGSMVEIRSHGKLVGAEAWNLHIPKVVETSPSPSPGPSQFEAQNAGHTNSFNNLKVVKGSFFPRLRNASFDGHNKFNIVNRNMYRTTVCTSSVDTEGMTDGELDTIR
ncbi:hypothetical protein C8R42DRAFT_25152 [Lentinula raphanica]|nr:hypothetical protein C8R42DRAFT_25152 [Lentinula raphanica]